MGEWKPIETAPKDGTFILVTGPRYMDEHLPPVAITRWVVSSDEWWEQISATRKELRREDTSSWDSACGLYPTHWQPLPPPPTDRERRHERR